MPISKQNALLSVYILAFLNIRTPKSFSFDPLHAGKTNGERGKRREHRGRGRLTTDCPMTIHPAAAWSEEVPDAGFRIQTVW
ncbi:hypothetical protein GOBAR_DD28327 [Gossypium barbadense]|nr:hypothetical protein GOBAR_DD28327 [Gossypium barbadense]